LPPAAGDAYARGKLRRPPPPPPVYVPAFSWTGFYVGGNLGYGWARATMDVDVAGIALLSASQDLKGLLGGVQAGYNWQTGSVVLGVEADFQFSAIKGSSVVACLTPACGLLGVTIDSTTKMPWFGTLRGRIGYAPDRWLIYATGGLAYGSVESSATATSLLATVTTTSTDQRMAWTVGGGVEAAFTSNWSAKLEYLYIDSGTVTTTYSLLGIGLITERDRLRLHVARVGLNYRF
jgi:outer membrane immunogenic protein